LRAQRFLDLDHRAARLDLDPPRLANTRLEEHRQIASFELKRCVK
jgi:hypothetical protein